MKTLCVAVVLLGLTSVCQPAPLTCEKLLKPVDSAPNLSGSWFVVAGSSDSCLVATIFNSVFAPSLKAEITSKNTPNTYSLNFTGKIYGYCDSDVDDFVYSSGSMFDVDENNAPTGSPSVLLQSSCPDCMVIKDGGSDYVNTLLLLSKRQTVTDAERAEFESQAKCLGWSEMQVFQTDHDYGNCKTVTDDDGDASEFFSMIFERLKASYTSILKCLVLGSVPSGKSVTDWVGELLA